MADATFAVEGLPELMAKMDGLSHDLKYKGGRFALRKAANLIRDKVKQSAQRLDDPETAESIAENVVVRFSPREFRKSGDLVFRVGVRGGAKSRQENQRNPGGDTFYWRYHEFGTEKMAARPFMRPALSESVDAATQEFVTEYGKAIERAIKRAARQSGGK